jgi:hypothetical protein
MICLLLNSGVEYYLITVIVSYKFLHIIIFLNSYFELIASSFPKWDLTVKASMTSKTL